MYLQTCFRDLVENHQVSIIVFTFNHYTLNFKSDPVKKLKLFIYLEISTM